MTYQDLQFAKVDLDRIRRRKFPEVIYADGKTPQQIISIAQVLQKNRHPVVVTKVDRSRARSVRRKLPKLKYNEQAKMLYRDTLRGRMSRSRTVPKTGIWVVTAGTSDIPIAEEACLTLELMNFKVDRLFDVGVAGLDRLLDHKKALAKAKVIVVVAGMDGALPSVVSGLVACPVVAVPTSVGYGASFEGMAALLTMLNSCSPGVAVVNIDNGFGAGVLAGMMLR